MGRLDGGYRRGLYAALTAVLAPVLAASVWSFAPARTPQRIDRTLRIHLDGKPGLSFEETARLLERFGRLVDELPPSSGVRQRDLRRWVGEILPWFQTEGVVARVVVPKAVVTDTFTRDGFANNHLLAAGSCWFDSVVVNSRVFNPTSSWYRRPDFLATLVHELAHVQGICIGTDATQVEASAQMAALEVMAAMANDGNKPMARALVFELRQIALDALEYEAWGNPIREQSAQALERRVLHSPLADAHNAAVKRNWTVSHKRSQDLRDLLDRYGEEPLQRVVAALRTARVWNIQLPINDPARGGSTSGPLKRLRIDDLRYFLAHAEAIVAEAALR
jgi:hypothetical protein